MSRRRPSTYGGRDSSPRCPGWPRIGAGYEQLETRLLLAFNPSPFEQELLESINRMRADPQGELDVLFASTRPSLVARDHQVQGAIDYFNVSSSLLLQQWSELTPSPPIAWSEQLTEVAMGHNEAMRVNDIQAHEIEGEDPLGTRVQRTGYRFSTVFENIFAFGESPVHTHAGFVIDWGEGPGGIQDPAGHRDNIMDPRVFDVGIAVLAENNPSTEVGPFLVTQDFGVPAVRGNPYVLGTAWTDLNQNGIYNSGEGLGGVQITVSGSSGTYTTTTMSAGGYQLRVPAGTYDVVAFGGPLSATYASGTIAVGSHNVKVDFETRSANQRPVARSDNRSLIENTPLLIDVLANDFDPDGTVRPATLAVAANPTNGTVSVSNGQLLYTPAPDFFGTDSFTYRVRDNRGAASSPAVVNITVTEASEPPSARSLTAETNEGVALAIPLVNHVTETAAPIDWSALEIVTPSPGGEAIWVNASRQFTFTPAPDFAGETSFEYRVPDVEGRFSQVATVTVRVNSADDAPRANGDLLVVVEDTVGILDVVTNDTDPDGSLFGATINLIQNGQSGNATTSGTVVSYLPNPGFVGRDRLTYQITDAQGKRSNEATVDVYVTNADYRWQNPANAVDVIPDDLISPLDALTIINSFGVQLETTPPPFLDADGNNAIGPIDALLVINSLDTSSVAANYALSFASTTDASDTFSTQLATPEGERIREASEVKTSGAVAQDDRLQALDIRLTTRETNDVAALLLNSSNVSEQQRHETHRLAHVFVDKLFAELGQA